VLASAGVLVAAVPAQAGWRGECTVMVSNATQYKIWCDGNGPESYRAAIKCFGTSGTSYRYGAWKWYGDRTGSYAACPGGVNAITSRWMEFS
jgi:hypothetical protein